MKRSHLRRSPLLLAAILFAVLMGNSSAAGASNDLAKQFAAPPDSTRPRCYWYWMDGNISEEGITADLEAMKRVGIGGAFIGVIGGMSGATAKTDLKELSEPWWKLIEHAIREAGRVGVDIGIFNCPGWSQSGGPWVKPTEAMRFLALKETQVRGPLVFNEKLPKPEGDFQDVAVIGFPAPACDAKEATISSRASTSIAFEMPSPFTARSLSVEPATTMTVDAELQVSEDGQVYRTLKKFKIERLHLDLKVGPVPLAPITLAFPATTARFFRLNLSKDCQLGAVKLSSAARVERYMEKQLAKVYEGTRPPFDTYLWAPQPEPESAELTVAPRTVVNLTKQMAPDGTLKWEVPEGEWIVVRAVMLPTGTVNAPATPEATGLEVDKLNRAALKEHFDAYTGKLLKRMPKADRKAWKYAIADSYETGPQNWTDHFAADFAKRYGYDPLRFLPVMTGRVVGSADQSDRFLWDLRRLVADRIASDYVGALRDLCEQNGLKLWLENYGHWGFPAEFLQYGGASDEVGGEFWVGDTSTGMELRAAASACHIYGKPQVWAEAFTGGPSFLSTPRELKAQGDWAFCHGINQFVLHVYIHQPREDQKPGINAWFGTEFNRHNTWFEQSKGWIDYMRRCSVLLQTGKPVAEIAYFIGEDTPKMDGGRKPSLPSGYEYDFINAEVIEQRLEVKNGRFVLPDGMSYKLLVLPESATLRPAVLRKISKLVADGGAVFGPAPERSPSLENFPACDAEVKALADSLWKQGRILTGNDLAQVLQKLDTPPDVVVPQAILWKHRKDAGRDIYFLSNQEKRARTETLSFRVANGSPSLWWPDSGRIEPVSFKVVEGRTEVALNFDPAGSVFVVFESAPPSPRGAAVAQSAVASAQELAGPWSVEFPNKKVGFEKLISWTDHADPDIKYYSGTATYEARFHTTATTASAFLDLGKVESIATVTLNGKAFPTLWKYPYRLDISSALKPGENVLTVAVVNTWNNRLVGDAALPPEKRQTFLTTSGKKEGASLQPSGLLGPVQLSTISK